MGNNCCAGQQILSQSDQYDWTHKQLSPIRIKDVDLLDEIRQGNVYKTATNTRNSSNHTSTNNSERKQQANFEFNKEAAKQCTMLARKSHGLKIRKPRQSFEESPMVKALMRQHPNPQEYRRMTSLDTESDAAFGAKYQSVDEGHPNTEEDDFNDLIDIKEQQNYTSRWSQQLNGQSNNNDSDKKPLQYEFETNFNDQMQIIRIEDLEKYASANNKTAPIKKQVSQQSPQHEQEKSKSDPKNMDDQLENKIAHDIQLSLQEEEFNVEADLIFDDDQDNLLNDSLSKNSNLEGLFNSTGKSHFTSNDNKETNLLSDENKENIPADDNKDLKADSSPFECVAMDLEVLDQEKLNKNTSINEKSRLEKDLMSEIQIIEQQLEFMQKTQRNEGKLDKQNWAQLNQLMNNVQSITSQQKKEKGKLFSIFSITERNEQSEATNGTPSLLSNMLRVTDSESNLISQLNRLSLLSQNLNGSPDRRNINHDLDICESFSKKKFSTSGQKSIQ